MRGKRDIRLEAKEGEVVSGHPCSGQTVRATARFVRLPKPHFSSGAVSLNAGRIISRPIYPPLLGVTSDRRKGPAPRSGSGFPEARRA